MRGKTYAIVLVVAVLTAAVWTQDASAFGRRRQACATSYYAAPVYYGTPAYSSSYYAPAGYGYSGYSSASYAPAGYSYSGYAPANYGYSGYAAPTYSYSGYGTSVGYPGSSTTPIFGGFRSYYGGY